MSKTKWMIYANVIKENPLLDIAYLDSRHVRYLVRTDYYFTKKCMMYITHACQHSQDSFTFSCNNDDVNHLKVAISAITSSSD